MSSVTSPDLPPTPAAPDNKSWYRRLYLKIEAASTGPYALWAMLAVAFADASFFPVPPFALMVPMVLAAPKTWWRLSLWGTLASLVGGIFGYYIGHWAGMAAADFFGLSLDFRVQRFGIDATVSEILTQHFWYLALACSVLPTPFKIVSIGSGILGVGFGEFMLAALIGRSARFFAVGGAMAFFGPKARKWLRV